VIVRFVDDIGGIFYHQSLALFKLSFHNESEKEFPQK